MNLFRFILGSVLMVACASGRLVAQGAGEPVYVPLKIKIVGYMDEYGTEASTVTATITADPAPAPAVGGVNMNTGEVDFPPQVLPVELGRESDLVISGDGAYASNFTLTPPPGYTLLIDGLERKSKAVNGTGVFKVRVLPALESTLAPAGTATEFFAGQVKWGVSLGSQRNGQAMAWLWLVGAGVSDWAPFLNSNNLYFEKDSDELVLYKLSGGIKRQIRSNEAFVDIITPNIDASITPAAYELRFYHPASMTTSGSLRTPLANMQPYAVYRIIDASSGQTKGLRIEKQICSLDPSPTRQVLRTEQTTLTRSGASDTSYVWTSTGWTVVGQPVVSQAVATWSPITGGHREVMEVQDLTANPIRVATKVTTDHIAPSAGLPRMVASVVADPDSTSSAGSTTAYYADMLNGAPELAKRYRFGFPQLSTSTGGAWSAVTYVDPDTRTPAIPTADKDKWLGVADTSFSPWLDTAVPTLAANSTPTMGTGMLATKYDYVKDVFNYPSRVTLVESYRDSMDSANRISKRTTDYTGTSQNGRTSIQATSKDFYGTGANDYLTSYRIYFREDDISNLFRNQVSTEVAPTGAKVSYIRQNGIITFGDPAVAVSFNVSSSAKSSRLGVITGAESASADTETTAMTTYGGYGIKPTYLLLGRSTLSFTYRDDYARVVRTESYLRSASATWELIAWESLTYNNRHQLTLRTASNGDTHELFYTGEYLTRDVDAQGVETIYDYDSAGRMWKSTRSAFAGRPALITESVFDGADRVVEQRSYAADNPNLKTITTRTYDLAGRVRNEKSSGSPLITTDYNPAARTVTVTNSATSATKINETYLDGQAKSVTGTGVIEERYAYALEADGRRRTEATSGPTGSLRTVKSWSDWLGRNLRSERPAPPGVTGPLVSETFYDAVTGLPIKGTSPLSADTLSTYDVVGERVLTGLDASPGGLALASLRDRITGKRNSAVFSENAWWATSESYTYMTAGSAAETIVGKSWTRLTGLSGGLVGETRSWDTEGNLTRRTVERDRATRTVTTRTWLPGITNPQVDVAIDGLAISSTAPDGLVATTLYDSLRRPTISRTPRSGAAGGTKDITTTYATDGLGTEATGLVWTVTDSDGRASTSVYDTAFRLKTTINPDQKSVTQAYNIRGQVTHVFGEATSPVRYVYDDYGQRTEQHTFRLPSDTAVYTSETQFHAFDAAETDRVVWSYDPATALLLNKTDPLNRSVSYTYDAAGRIATRQWARLLADGLTPLTATPNYDPLTGDLLSTSYNDGVTPTVSTTYDRMGRPLTVTDATGTRTFVRDTQKPWRTNSEQLPTYYGSDRALSWLYDEQSGTSGSTGYVMGRSRGFRLGTAAQPAALLEQTMAWSDTGRLQSISSTRDTTSTQNFAYTYTPNSRLVESLTAAGTTYSLIRTWDPMRNLLTQIETTSGANSYARFGYTHTILGQRETANQTGQAFATDAGDPAETTTTYDYNARGEVTSALTGVGSPTTAPSSLIPGRKFAFDYDLAGNRVKSTHQGDLNGSAAVNYTVGKGNQLTQRDNPVASVSGVIANTSTVMVVDQTPLTAADRQGKHWQHDVTSPETGTPVPVADDAGTTPTPQEYPRTARTLVTLASIIGGGSGGADLTSFDRRMLTMSPRNEQLRYDRDGNLLRDGTWDYVWDAENRLVRMETHYWLSDQERKKLEFTYDYQGRRVSKRVQLWPVGAAGYGPSTETRFLYDGWNLIGELGWNTATATWALNKSYTWGLDLVGSLTASGGVGGLIQISDHADNQRYLPGYDGNGNVAVLVRASDGYRAAAYEYGPYGEVLRSEGTYAAKNTFRFSTKFTDTESGLVYYGMRYYDSRNGRFINRDPIEERGGLNLYGFCGNDGVNRYDVLGMSWFSKAFKKLWKSSLNPLNFKERWHKITKWMGKNQWAALVIAAVVSYFTFGLGSAWAVSLGAAQGGVVAGAVGGAVAGFVGGATSTSLMGGDLQQSLTAGAWGALGGAIGGGINGYFGDVGQLDWSEFRRALTSGIADGGLSSLRGDKFSSALLSGFVGGYAGSAIQFLGAKWYVGAPLSGAVGGITSRLSGGRFEDGFASASSSAALQYAYESDSASSYGDAETTKGDPTDPQYVYLATSGGSSAGDTFNNGHAAWIVYDRATGNWVRMDYAATAIEKLQLFLGKEVSGAMTIKPYAGDPSASSENVRFNVSTSGQGTMLARAYAMAAKPPVYSLYSCTCVNATIRIGAGIIPGVRASDQNAFIPPYRLLPSINSQSR